MTKIREIPEAKKLQKALGLAEQERTQLSHTAAQSVVWALIDREQLQAAIKLQKILQSRDAKDVEIEDVSPEAQEDVRNIFTELRASLDGIFNDVRSLQGQAAYVYGFGWDDKE